MHRLAGTVFVALLARAAVSQAAYARLTGITPRQVNKWCRGQAAVPVWAGLIAVMLLDRSPEALAIDLEEASRGCPTPSPSPR
jgi:DNA-binding transcriptional regulator YdaS (Cro superfamily)